MSRKMNISVLLLLVVCFSFSATSFAALKTVYNNETSGTLNVRSFPNTTSAIIATVGLGSDVITYCVSWASSDCATTDPNTTSGNYEWAKFYYPNYTLGKYSTTSYGWMATEPRWLSSYYLSGAIYATVIKSGGTPKSYTNSCTFSGPSSAVFALNADLPRYTPNGVHISVSDCNLNSWEMNEPYPETGNYNRVINGWDLNAKT